jgi:Uroporphyrinogen-III decarboxylase
MGHELDIEQFWKDEETAHKDNCFSKEAKQVALGIRMSDECVFAELGEDGEPWGYTPPERRLELNKRYNEKALKIVGRKLLNENPPAPSDSHFPGYKQIGEVFGGQYMFDGKTTWLQGTMDSTDDLKKMLDKVDNMNLRDFILPANWESEKKRIFEQYGRKPGQFWGIRGPVTLATSVYGVENLLYLFYDDPDLYRRFSDTIKNVVLEYIKIFIEESGHTADNFAHGFSFSDDDSNLLTPEMYEAFGYPILKSVFDFTSPNSGDNRYQHSDSAMGHIIPILARLNLTGCNFGPTVTVTEIRAHMKTTRIDGQLAPFTFMRNNTADIIAEVKRDCEMAKINDIRGLNLSTAGSINNGSLLTSMKTVMQAIQEYGQY